MNSGKRSFVRTVSALALLATLATFASVCSAQQGQAVDKRKLTTVQTSTLDVGGVKNAVQVRYLNLPWGERTFGYMEVGGDDYYSNRTWPIAQLTLAKSATLEGKELKAGDYIFVISPKSWSGPMSLSV